MIWREDVQLADYTTLRVGGPARYFAVVQSEAELQEAFGKAFREGLPFEVIGGGSNLLVPDRGFHGVVVRVAIPGVERTGAAFDVGAGENWDALVQLTAEAGCAGLECLAGIPGSVGAAPVQNIGAYGQEVAETIESVRALDRRSGGYVELDAAACRFRYRQSVFNTEEQGRYLLTRVRFQLRPGGAPQLKYADLQRWFQGRADLPTLPEVAAAVRSIRAAKGMVLAEGDQDTWSAGSYFKNPVVELTVLTRLASVLALRPEQVPHWQAGEGRVKLSAAWLMERAGFGKGFTLGRAGLSTKHALAVTNRGKASYADLLALEEAVRAGVQERFGVLLEREPVELGAMGNRVGERMTSRDVEKELQGGQ